MQINADQALKKLINGNNRFVNNNSRQDKFFSQTHSKTVKPQMPFAIILGCSDSRVPIEIIFDRFLGDLFVLRIAGNVVATSQIGSIEFALHHFDTPLIVVLGHSHCGAILASLDECREPTPETDSIHRITSLICPVICKFVGQNLPKKKLEKLSIEANVNNSIKRLKNNSQIIQNRLADNRLKIVGASYSLRTRKVHFL